MITIREPEQNITKLWGKPLIDDHIYRMMKYVLRVDYKGKVLLYNVVTAQLVVLNDAESEILDSLPVAYTPEMNPLIEGYYLIPAGQDEHEKVVSIRNVMVKLSEVRKHPGINSYTILPTTACNARCYYCFEQGMTICTMSEKTAEDAVDFIDHHCGPKRNVFIKWFGGEPTVAADRIDQICSGLSKRGIQISSSIITNGFLFDSGMVSRAKDIWKLDHAQITVDGVEDTYNQIKAFVNPADNPFQKVMRNIGLLLDSGIKVGLRMNFDLNTFHEFDDLLKEAIDRYGENPLLQVYAHPVIGEYADHSGVKSHGDEMWFQQKVLELNTRAQEVGMLRKLEFLPGLKYQVCQAYSNSAITITPDGGLVRCPEQYNKESYVGNVREGIFNYDIVKIWREFADYDRCSNCIFFPQCIRLKLCGVKEQCGYFKEREYENKRVMTDIYDRFCSQQCN